MLEMPVACLGAQHRCWRLPLQNVHMVVHVSCTVCFPLSLDCLALAEGTARSSDGDSVTPLRAEMPEGVLHYVSCMCRQVAEAVRKWNCGPCSKGSVQLWRVAAAQPRF